MKQSLFIILTMAVTALPSLGSTVPIYSNFTQGDNDSTNPFNDANLTGYTTAWKQAYVFGTGGTTAWGIAEAMPFTVGGLDDLYLQEVDMGMYKFPSNYAYNSLNNIGANHDNLTIEVVGSVAGGSLPNTSNILEVLAVNPTMAEDSLTFLNLDSASHPLLQHGQTYWIIAQPTAYTSANTSDDSFYAWIGNNEGAQWHYTTSQYSRGWQGYQSQGRPFTAPTLSVFGSTSLDTGAPTPEPASLILAFAGLSVFAVWSRNRAS